MNSHIYATKLMLEISLVEQARDFYKQKLNADPSNKSYLHKRDDATEKVSDLYSHYFDYVNHELDQVNKKLEQCCKDLEAYDKSINGNVQTLAQADQVILFAANLIAAIIPLGI